MPFPENFIWGAATASYQIEGAHDQDGKGPSIWDSFCRIPGKTYQGHTGDVACDHYHRYKEDVALMKSIGLRAYRLSISWSRILPEGNGSINEKGISFYDRLIDELLEANIEPWITLYHWDLPLALHYQGGWLSPNSPVWFEKYTRVVVKRLSDRVRHWFTINEPQVFIGLGYAKGEHAPGWKLSFAECLQAGHNALLAHGRSVLAIREEAASDPLIGASPVGICARPKTEKLIDIDAAKTATFAVSQPKDHSPRELQGALWNSAWWMDPLFLGKYPESGLKAFHGFVPAFPESDMEVVNQPLDFFGANIYHGLTVESNPHNGYTILNPPEGSPVNSMGWDITPDILYWGGKFFHERYKLPIVITENGMPAVEIPDENGQIDDTPRAEFIKSYLRGVERGLKEGLPFMGYFYWSFLDNFEWAYGYSQRFGLTHIDYKTLSRMPKKSSSEYARIIRMNSLESPSPTEETSEMPSLLD